MKRIMLVLAFAAVCLCSCGDVYRYTETEFYSMTTFVNVISDTDSDYSDVKEYASDFEKRVSRTVKDSEINTLNCESQAELSDDTLYILEKSLEIAEVTDGAFNPCMGNLSELWDITSGNNHVPSENDVKQALEKSSFKEVAIDGKTVIVPDGMKIDLGGVAKGYVLEKMVEIVSSGREDANVCVSIGGNVGVKGSSEANRKSGKSGWNVGITNPFDKNELSATLTLEDGFVAISGAYERFFEKDGEIYHHIFDPQTGYPAKSDIASVAVINKNGLEGDALSTALFVMGKEEAIEFYNKGIYDFDMIIIGADGNVAVTENISDNFTLNSQAKGITGKITVID